MNYRVVQAWTASYPDPIRVAAGAALRLSGRRDLWDGHLWLWAIAPDGREGWVPDRILAPGPDGPNATDAAPAGAVATEDYDARELTCRAGDRLTGERGMHGWIWCRLRDDPDSPAGWVPRHCLCTDPECPVPPDAEPLARGRPS